MSQEKNLPSVGVIGLGIIGSRVATLLSNAGFAVSVWNRTHKDEPNFLESPAAVAQNCDIIQLFVADAKAVFDVLESMGNSLTSRHIIICSATIGPDATFDVERKVKARGAKFLDASFTGSKGAAENRALVYYIGGDDETYQSVEAVLKASSKAIIRVGAVGQAALIKVVTNVLSAVAIETLAEMIAVVKAAGISPEILLPVLEHHAIRSPMMDLKLPKMLQADYEPHFALKHMLKDVLLGMDLGNHYQLNLPATAATEKALQEGMSSGWANLDFASVMKRYS